MLRQLQNAVVDLTYPSESDEPWEAFAWPVTQSITTPAQAIKQHVDTSRAIVEESVEAFFNALSEAENAKRYDQLRRMLLQTLENVSVFRVGDGEVRVDVYVLGTLADGSWAGIQTTSVET